MLTASAGGVLDAALSLATIRSRPHPGQPGAQSDARHCGSPVLNQGPYRPAQVAACAATLGLTTALLSLRWNPFVVAAGITIGFWTVWTVQAASEDVAGLHAVGASLLLGGLVLGTVVTGAAGYAARPLVHRLMKP